MSIRVYNGFALLVLLAACGDDAECADEIRIAATVSVQAPAGVKVDQVTIERRAEETCGSVSTREGELLYTCWEQGGGGTYTVRVYSGDGVWTNSVEIESASCHVKERAELSFDLSLDP